MAHAKMIQNLLDGHGGILPSCAWPGVYPYVYYVEENERKTADIVCSECANVAVQNQDISSWTVWGCDPYWEGPVQHCSNCNKEIASAYGDPDEADEADEADVDLT